MSRIRNSTAGLLASLQEKLPEQTVGLVPADAFFVRKVELPEGLSGSDLTAFIRLDLEGNSPFPMDQLAWGYLQHPDSPHAFVYASPKARLKNLKIDTLESFYQLFPGFISLFGESSKEPRVRFLSQSGVISALFFEAGQTVPTRLISRKVKAELLTDDALLEARDALAENLSADPAELEEGLWLGEGYEIQPDGRVCFLHRHVHPGRSKGLKPHALQLSSQDIWAVDLRDEAYALREQTIRQRSHWIWRSLKAAGWVAAILLLLQVLNFGVKAYDALQMRKINQIEPMATRVENKLTLATRLNQSTEEDLKPFVLMEVINPLRPDSIFYEKVRSRAYNTLEIEGKSTEGVTPVNAFADSVSQLPYVDGVENNSQTRNNQTSFEFIITFSDMPPEPEGGFFPEEVPSTEEIAPEEPSA